MLLFTFELYSFKILKDYQFFDQTDLTLRFDYCFINFKEKINLIERSKLYKK